MRLREGVTFDKSKEMLIEVWNKVRPPKVDLSLVDGENLHNEIEQYWKQINDHEVLNFSVCWLFCYGNSAFGYEAFTPEIPALWKKLFDIPFDCFEYFQTAMDGGKIPVSSEDRYLHKRREKYRNNMDGFTFY